MAYVPAAQRDGKRKYIRGITITIVIILSVFMFPTVYSYFLRPSIQLTDTSVSDSIKHQNMQVGLNQTDSSVSSAPIGNNVNSEMANSLCSQSIPFSFNLANTGAGNGTAIVQLQADGNSIWSNNYFVQSGKTIYKSGEATIDDCNNHSYELIIASQEKI
jgi:hypothetical protein